MEKLTKEQEKIFQEKEKILEPIFISTEEMQKLKIVQKNKDMLELKKTIASQKDLIKSLPEILSIIIRKEDTMGNNILLQKIFQDFCIEMDRHGITYNQKKIELKITKTKERLSKLKTMLEDSA